jgi:nitrogen fixation protein FixH
MSMMHPRAFGERRFTGRQFLAILLGAFLVVSAVNGLMIWYAESSWTGLVSDSAYEEGLGFDRVLAESRAEAALGWRGTIAYDAVQGRLTVTLADRAGRPLSGLGLSAEWLRPTREGFDTTVALRELAPGRYGADIRPPLPGQWDVRVTVTDRGRARFHAQKRLVIGP